MFYLCFTESEPSNPIFLIALLSFPIRPVMLSGCVWRSDQTRRSAGRLTVYGFGWGLRGPGKGNLPQRSLFEAQGTGSSGTIRTPSVLKSIRPCCASPRILRFAFFGTRWRFVIIEAIDMPHTLGWIVGHCPQTPTYLSNMGQGETNFAVGMSERACSKRHELTPAV